MAKNGHVLQAELPGVWKRSLLIDEAGNEDPASRVYWVQSATLCGDIRQHIVSSTLADLSANGGLPLMDAFAGELIEAGGAFRWEPSLSYREPSGPPDEGRLSWIGGDLLEDGVHKNYRELWVRIAQSSGKDYALVLRNPGSGRCLVLKVGRFLFYARQNSAHPRDKAEFSLFELLPEGARLVLSTAESGQAMYPRIDFVDTSRRTVRISHWGELQGAGEIWHVETIEGAAHELAGLDLPSERTRP
jgi:hypothetical protein